MAELEVFELTKQLYKLEQQRARFDDAVNVLESQLRTCVDGEQAYAIGLWDAYIKSPTALVVKLEAFDEWLSKVLAELDEFPSGTATRKSKSLGIDGGATYIAPKMGSNGMMCDGVICLYRARNDFCTYMMMHQFSKAPYIVHDLVYYSVDRNGIRRDGAGLFGGSYEEVRETIEKEFQNNKRKVKEARQALSSGLSKFRLEVRGRICAADVQVQLDDAKHAADRVRTEIAATKTALDSLVNCEL